MSERDRLAADLRDEYVGIHDIACETQPDEPCDCADTFAGQLADRLIERGWTRLTEERLARALHAGIPFFERPPQPWSVYLPAILAALREDQK